MLCRALFAAIVVSYVLCVLLMSGVHKEELDAQTLRKLQRHNVNIADIDDQKLREQCFVDHYVSSLTTDRLDLKEHRRSREQPAFVDENGATKAQLTRIIEYLKNQEKHKKETTTKSVVTTETIDLNSLFSLIKNISVHESITEASTDSPPNVTNKDSAKPTLKKLFEYFKKQAENIKQTKKPNVVHTENLEFNPLNTRIKKPDPEKPITKEQLQEILDDYFKKQDTKDTTSRPVNTQSGTTTKSNIAELSSLLSNKNHDIEFIADSVSHITLKSGKAKDRENIGFARKDNKSQEIINTNKTLPETSNLQMKPQVLNDIEYVSNIVARILRQKQQSQAQAATINSNEKKRVRDIDTVEDKISDIKTTTPTSHVLNNYNSTENVEILDTVEPRSHNKQNDLINALLKELRNRDKLLNRYKEETSSNYDQYNIDNRNQKQLKNSLEEEPKGAMYKLRGTSNQAEGIFSRLKNRPVIDARYKSKQPINIRSWNRQEEEEDIKPFNQPSERGKPIMQNTVNEYYPEANRHHKRKWLYFAEGREQTPEPTLEMEQKTDILREPYNTMNNENDRSLDNAYKPPWQYFSNRRNSKETIPTANQKNVLKRQFKSITNTINNENYPDRERKPKYEWPVYYEDAVMAGNLQLQNNNALVNKPNELKKSENKQERIPTDLESPLMEPVLSKWFKNKWPIPQSGTSFKKEPKSKEELTKDKEFLNNRKTSNQNDLQINNDNVLFENETLYDNFKKYLMDEKVKNLKDEIEKNDHTKILNVKDNNLSPKVLKQIADTVKAIVLEDLKKEKSTINVFSTTPSTTTSLTEQPTRAPDTTTTTAATTTTTTAATTTTTTAATTTTTTAATTTTTTAATTTTTEITSTTPKEEQKLQEASKALEQFMKFFEKFQVLKNQLNPDNGTNQQNLDVVKEQNFQVFKPLATPNPPVVYEFPKVVELKKQKEIILDPFTDKENWIKMQTQMPRRYPPVMFQTNSNEIAPLRLPLDRPVLFNTVLLTTRAPPRRYNQAVDIVDNPPRSAHKTARVGIRTRHKQEQPNNDVQPRDKYEESFKPRHIGNHIEKLVGKDYFHNVKKFHEKMEREERPPRSSKKCTSSNGCPDKISQRKQRPLGRSSNFDDKHFKNFLKTQQKVNAMLERILATKAKRGHPMSTEII